LLFLLIPIIFISCGYEWKNDGEPITLGLYYQPDSLGTRQHHYRVQEYVTHRIKDPDGDGYKSVRKLEWVNKTETRYHIDPEVFYEVVQQPQKGEGKNNYGDKQTVYFLKEIHDYRAIDLYLEIKAGRLKEFSRRDEEVQKASRW
jgi:hypothetical protein